MQIRAATEEDIPQIVNLLKQSLGEGLMPKSESYWRWKHLQNPFGKSPVLTCWQDEMLIGVRAFMRWEWSYQGKTYRSLRAVDTATHPKHQGKGIFKKLTLALVEHCKGEGDHFIFNTPNTQSKPGYLKMGWIEAGKLPVTIGLRRPFNMIKNILINKSSHDGMTKNNSITDLLVNSALPQLIDETQQIDSIATKISIPYLKWRYQDVPVANYFALRRGQRDELDALVIGRIKASRAGREFRITDFFSKPDNNPAGILETMKELGRANDIDFCTISGVRSLETDKLVGAIRWKGLFGPSVTVRELSLTDLSILQNFCSWSPTLGDLELF